MVSLDSRCRSAALGLAAGLAWLVAGSRSWDETPMDSFVRSTSTVALVRLDNQIPLHLQPALRRPLALGLADQGQTLWVAHRRGTVTRLETADGTIRGEYRLAESLAALQPLDDGAIWLAVDDRAGRLLWVDASADEPILLASLDLPGVPVEVKTDRDQRRVAIASLWTNDLTLVELPAREDWRSSPRLGDALAGAARRVELPFAAAHLMWLPDGDRLIAGGAFAGELAVVDAADGSLLAVEATGGHNIGGFALSGDDRSLVLTQQILNQRAPITSNGIEFGDVMKNVLRVIDLQAADGGEDGWARRAPVHELGFAGLAAADPEGLSLADGSRWVVVLGGVDQVAIVHPQSFHETRLKVGRRPTAVAVDATGRFAYVANTLDDSISVIDCRSVQVTETWSLGPASEWTPADRGESLFYDGRLSRDDWMSCHSCHTDGHANGLLADTLGDDTHGSPKRVLSLLNVSLTDPWAWNGSVKELSEQIDKSVRLTMHGRGLSGEQVNDLAAFLFTLQSPPSRLGDSADSLGDRIEGGRQVFVDLGCDRCHVPPLTYTTNGRFDVGLRDEWGLALYNPPSLIGVGHHRQLFHDGRASSLEEVLDDVGHQLTRPLDADERSDLLLFLRSL